MDSESYRIIITSVQPLVYIFYKNFPNKENTFSFYKTATKQYKTQIITVVSSLWGSNYSHGPQKMALWLQKSSQTSLGGYKKVQKGSLELIQVSWRSTNFHVVLNSALVLQRVN